MTLDQLGNLGFETLVSSHLQPLDPVPTKNPSPSTSLGLQLTHLWGACRPAICSSHPKLRPEADWEWRRGSLRAGSCADTLGLVWGPSDRSMRDPEHKPRGQRAARGGERLRGSCSAPSSCLRGSLCAWVPDPSPVIHTAVSRLQSLCHCDAPSSFLADTFITRLTPQSHAAAIFPCLWVAGAGKGEEAMEVN